MKKIINKSSIIFVAIVMFSTLILSSCTEDDDSEYVSCGSGTCDAAEPYSNDYTTSCYATQSDCESATGHACKNCN